jgi:hypothetical protein
VEPEGREAGRRVGEGCYRLTSCVLVGCRWRGKASCGKSSGIWHGSSTRTVFFGFVVSVAVLVAGAVCLPWVALPQ